MTQACPFLELPAELRISIHNYAVDWNDTQLLSDDPLRRATPTILLLNRQIHYEAMVIPRYKPLTIDCRNDSHSAGRTGDEPLR